MHDMIRWKDTPVWLNITEIGPENWSHFQWQSHALVEVGQLTDGNPEMKLKSQQKKREWES